MNWEKAAKEAEKMSKMSSEQFEKYRFSESARDRLASLGKAPSKKDDRAAYEDYMDKVRRAKAEMKGGSIGAAEDILRKQGEVDAQRKQYEYLKSIGALGQTFGVGNKWRDQTFEEYLMGLRGDESMRREMFNRHAAREYADARKRYKNPQLGQGIRPGARWYD